MNLILLNSTKTHQNFPTGTLQAKHLLSVMKISPGSTFWCGVENGARGIATVENIDALGNIAFSVEWEKSVPANELPPVRLLVGLSRPQTMKKVFATASEIGCSAIDVFVSERGDPAYAQSSLWRENDSEINEILRKSAEQTCTTQLPEIRLFKRLEDAASKILSGGKFFLDVYAQEAFPQAMRRIPTQELTLAIGSERGWTDAERKILCENAFVPAHIGARVLRVETAVAVSLSAALAQMNCWTSHSVVSV